MRAVIVAQELVVVAGDVDDLGALARLAQHLLHEVVVRLRPVPARFQRPAIDDIADQVDRVGVVAAQEIEQSFGLRAAGPEMHVGDKQRAERRSGLSSLQVNSHARALTKSHDRSMTAGSLHGTVNVIARRRTNWSPPALNLDSSARRQSSDMGGMI